MKIPEAERLCEIARASGAICAVNFGYSGYPMAIQAREMVRNGDLGEVRLVVAEFAHGFHASDADNARIRWRYDPVQTGVSSILADCGIHALHMAQFITGQKVARVSADFAHCVAGRALEDDAQLACRFSGGAVGRLWTSAVAIGQMHGFSMRVFGTKGGLRWHQEMPNQLYFSPLGQPTRTLERGDDKLYPAAITASRIAIGHAEGMFGAFGNIYRNLHTAITAREVPTENANYPTVWDGSDMVRAVHAAAASAARQGAWVELASLAVK
jgi:predicted dehydrogenase